RAVDQRLVGIGAIEILGEDFVEPLDIGILHGIDVVAVEGGQFGKVVSHYVSPSSSFRCARQREPGISCKFPLDSGFEASPRPGMTKYQSSNIGGGTNPPNSRSISSASFSGVRSSSQGPTICTPTGKPSGAKPVGIAVD